MLKKAINNLTMAHVNIFYATGETPDECVELHKRLVRLDTEIRAVLRAFKQRGRKNGKL